MPELRVVNVTFLFTDVEGSTRLVKQLRDGYAAVLSDHRRLVRDAFARYGGEEVDTQGDAFFYVFSRARDAAAAAADAQRALQAHAWPEDAELRVRMGLHTGEPVLSEGSYHGIGVHRAARIMAAGHGGQILASQATAAMLADDELPGVEQRDLGEFKLKDLDRPERVFQLDVEGLPSEFPPLRTGEAPTAYEGKEDELVAAAAGAHRPVHRRPLVIGALAGVLAAAVAIPVFALGRGSDGGQELARVQDNAVGVVDAQSHKIIDETLRIASPQRVAAGEGAIWVTSSSGGGNVVRLDPESHDVVDTIAVGNGPVGIAVGDGAVWVANSEDGTVSRIDPATNQEVGERIKVGNTPTGVAFGAGAVWVTNTDDLTVSRIDPVTGAVGKPIDVGVAARWIAVGGGAVWVTDPVGNKVVRIDVQSGTPTDSITVGSGPTAIAYDDDAVWVTNSLDGSLSRVDAKLATLSYTIPVGVAPNGIAVTPDDVWMTDEVGGTLLHFDPATRETVPTTLGGRPEGMTLADGSLWIAVQASGAAHRGGTLQMRGYVDFIDPALTYSLTGGQVLSTVYDGLVAYKKVGGAEGNRLVPDLASSLPTPTDNGRTYTFRLRKGIKFSDGSAVKASAVRYSLERLFKVETPRPDFYEGILGGVACRKNPKRCDLSQGVVTDDDAGTVRIRLREPDPDFLHKLALTFASVVPIDTPTPAVTPIPGTGPYRIAEFTPDKRLRLVRNPHFKVWWKAAQPEANPDEIVVEQAEISDDKAVTAVQRGRLDIKAFLPQDRMQEIRTRYAAQLHITPRAAVFLLILNIRRPPFDNELARRAVAFAVDRARLVEGFGGSDVATPTCQLLPPNFPGYRRYCPYTVDESESGVWTAPDLERARKLVAQSGTKGMRVEVIGRAGDTGGHQALTTVLLETLKQLGYDTSVRLLSGEKYEEAILSDHPQEGHATENGWFPDYQTPAGFVTGLFECGAATYACDDPALNRTLAETLELQTRDPQAANEAWARVDRELVDRAVVIPVITSNWVEFVSKRLGNYQRHPFYGTLISQLWLDEGTF